MCPRTSPVVLSAIFEQLFSHAAIEFRQLPRQEIGRQFAGAAPDHAFSHELVDDLFDRSTWSHRLGLHPFHLPPCTSVELMRNQLPLFPPPPLIPSSAESPPSRRPKAVRQILASSIAFVRISGTPRRSITNAAATVRPMRWAVTPCSRAMRRTSSGRGVETTARACDSLKRSAAASTSSACPARST